MESVALFRGPRDRVRTLARALSEAPAVHAVADGAKEVRELGFRLLGEGMAAVHLTRIVSELNDLMTRRLLDLVAQQHELGGLQWAWMALGSEGRLEQTLYTDQDNAIIFRPGGGDSAEAIRSRLLPYARAVNEALARCGFRLCPGDIMAGNPRWCLSEAEWRDRFARWVDTGDPEALLHGAIFFDFRLLQGDAPLVEELRRWLSAYVVRQPLFLRQMSENALRNRPSMRGLGRIARWLGRDARFDVKLHGVSPFSDGARVLALSRGLSQTSTTERFRAWARTAHEQKQAEGWTRAFNSLQTYRLQRQLQCYAERTPMDNQLDPATLSSFDLAVLRAALKEAANVQRHLAVSYQLRN